MWIGEAREKIVWGRTVTYSEVCVRGFVYVRETE